jgi:hypothetical protein
VEVELRGAGYQFSELITRCPLSADAADRRVQKDGVYLVTIQEEFLPIDVLSQLMMPTIIVINKWGLNSALHLAQGRTKYG